MVHEDSEIIAEIGSGDAEGVHAGDDQDIANEEESAGKVLNGGVEEDIKSRLIAEGLLIEVITNDSDGEDDDCEEVASVS